MANDETPPDDPLSAPCRYPEDTDRLLEIVDLQRSILISLCVWYLYILLFITVCCAIATLFVTITTTFLWIWLWRVFAELQIVIVEVLRRTMEDEWLLEKNYKDLRRARIGNIEATDYSLGQAQSAAEHNAGSVVDLLSDEPGSDTSFREALHVWQVLDPTPSESSASTPEGGSQHEDRC